MIHRVVDPFACHEARVDNLHSQEKPCNSGSTSKVFLMWKAFRIRSPSSAQFWRKGHTFRFCQWSLRAQICYTGKNTTLYHLACVNYLDAYHGSKRSQWATASRSTFPLRVSPTPRQSPKERDTTVGANKPPTGRLRDVPTTKKQGFDGLWGGFGGLLAGGLLMVLFSVILHGIMCMKFGGIK